MFSFQFCNGSFNVGEFQNHLTVCMRRHGGAQQQQRSEDQVSVTTQPYFRYIGHSIIFVAREKGRIVAFCNNFVRMCTKLNFHPKWINVMCFCSSVRPADLRPQIPLSPLLTLHRPRRCTSVTNLIGNKNRHRQNECQRFYASI